MNPVNTDKKNVEKIFAKLPKDTVIGEFSGRDSAAAIIKSLERRDIDNILPVASFAGIEYGDMQILEKNHEYTKKRIEDLWGEEKRLFPLVYYSNPCLWSVINARLTSVLIKKFGFYTPCIGCHAYFHILRVPMALELGKIIISGERESHDGRIKVNQLPLCLDSYKKILSYFGVDLIMPLQYLKEGKGVEKILGSSWEEGKSQPQCVFSGNYRDLNGESMIEEKQIKKFLEEFLEPVLIKIVTLFIQKEDISERELLEEVEGLL